MCRVWHSRTGLGILATILSILAQNVGVVHILCLLEFRVSEKTAGGAAWLKSMNSNRADALRSRCHAFGIRHVLSLGPEAGFLETKEQTAVVCSIKSRFFGLT